MTKTILITGVSGFIAKHVALEFLKAGYAVRGTIRSVTKGDAVAATLTNHTDISRLSFCEADLMSDAGWQEAVAGCDCVAHLASPFPLAQPKDENDLIKPAVEGTLRVLKASAKAGVKRFVQTSSSVAIMYGHGHDKTSFSEADWSVIDGPGMTAYGKSKTLAEREARDFVTEHAGKMHFATVNPGVVFGPALDSTIGSSLEIIEMLMTGKYPGAPKINFPVVDVRDVAKMHLLAMETNEPSGGRYVGVSEVMWMMDVARALRDRLGDRARKVPRFELPNFMVKLVGLFDPAARTIIPELGIGRSMDNSRTRVALGIDFISGSDATVASAESLIEHGII